VAPPDTKVAAGQDKKAQIVIWSDSLAHHASYF